MTNTTRLGIIKNRITHYTDFKHDPVIYSQAMRMLAEVFEPVPNRKETNLYETDA